MRRTMRRQARIGAVVRKLAAGMMVIAGKMLSASASGTFTLTLPSFAGS